MVIKRVGPLSCAKIAAMLYAMLGLMVGAVFSLGAIAGVLGSPPAPNAPFLPAIFGVGAIVLFPILYACFGFVGTLIMAALYNVAAGVMGGVEVDI